MSSQEQSQLSATGSMLLQGFDYLELYVGNARQAAHYYRTAFGYQLLAYAGPETGVRDRVSFVVAQGEIRLVLTSATTPESEIAEHFHLHDDGVKDIAFTVADAAAAFEQTVSNGAKPVMEPTVLEDRNGQLVKATVAVFGDTVHSFIQRRDYDGVFAPHYSPIPGAPAAKETGLMRLDHLAIGVEPGMGDSWVEFYARTLGLSKSQHEEISSDYSGMKTHVVRDGSDRTIFVIVEPVAGKRKSPIEEYLSSYGGAGVHHIAVLSADIIATVGALRANGIEFAWPPETYYEGLTERVGPIEAGVDALREHSILVDRDEWGYLMQIFAKPAQTRPTYFFEVIQRVKARGFGNGNIKALFEAIEREQLRRGNA